MDLTKTDVLNCQNVKLLRIVLSSPYTKTLQSSSLHDTKWLIISRCIGDGSGTGQEGGEIKLATVQPSASSTFLDGKTRKKIYRSKAREENEAITQDKYERFSSLEQHLPMPPWSHPKIFLGKGKRHHWKCQTLAVGRRRTALPDVSTIICLTLLFFLFFCLLSIVLCLLLLFILPTHAASKIPRIPGDLIYKRK